MHQIVPFSVQQGKKFSVLGVGGTSTICISNPKTLLYWRVGVTPIMGVSQAQLQVTTIPATDVVARLDWP